MSQASGLNVLAEVRQAEVEVQLVEMASKAEVQVAEAHFHGLVSLLMLCRLRWM